MEIYSNITLNMQAPSYATVYSPQDQTLTRSVRAHLLNGSEEWTIPVSALLTIRYAKPDGTIGWYDTLEDGSSAYSYDGNVVTFGIAAQALTVPGTVLVQIDFYTSGGEKLSTFTFRLLVTKSVLPDDSITSSDYFNVLTAEISEAAQIFQEIKAAYGAPLTANTAAAMTDQDHVYVYTGTTGGGFTNGHWYYWNGSAWTDGGNYNSTGFTTDKTLHIADSAADSKTVGDAIAAYYSSSTTYQVGDYCLYNGVLYRCTTGGSNHTPGSGSTYWTATTIMEEAGSGVGNSIATAYSASSSTNYAVGDYVVYQRSLYRCIAATTGGTWDSTKWTAAILADDVESLNNALKVETVLTGWEKGGFNTSNGSNFSDNSRIRNQTVVGVSTGVRRFTLAAGYEALMYAWDLEGNYVGAYKTDGTWTKTVSGWKTVTEFNFTTVPNYVVKLAVGRVPLSAYITTAEGSNVTFYCYTDNTLTKAGKAADAKKVGDEFANSSNALNASNSSVYQKWEKGTFNSVTGEYYSSDARIRTDYMAGLSTGVEKIYSENGFSMLLFAWDTNGNFVGSYKSSDTFTTDASGYKYVTEFDCNLFPNYIVKVSVTDATASTSIAISDGANIHFQFNDETLTKEYKSADAKVVGDTIDAIKYEIHLVANGYDLKNEAYIKSSDGSEVSSQSWLCTDYIDVSDYETLNVKMSNVYVEVDAGLAFYDQTKTNIPETGVNCIVDESWSVDNPTMSVFDVNVPIGAKYVRVSSRLTNKAEFFVHSGIGEIERDNNLPTPVLFFDKSPATPTSGYENRALIDTFIDAEDISICARVDVSSSTILFLGSEDYLEMQHASHVQYDFDLKEIRIYSKGSGQSIPSTVIHTVDFSSLGDITYAQIYIGRKNRQLWVAVENYVTGEKAEYVVSDGEQYNYPAGWLEDRLVYGVITGTADYKRITAVTKAEPQIAFIGDSITEGYGIPYESSWAYQVGHLFDSFLCLGRSGGTIVTAKRQVDDIISKIKPKYVVVCIGTNGGNTESNIKTLCERIRYYGAFPILCRIPVMSNASTSRNINNTTISPQLENTVGMDYATMLPDGSQDTSKFQSDRIHPNVTGATAMAERFWSDVGWILF